MIGKLDRTDLDERGVSPVIGVILMVAITVILAAVIGTFVLGLGGQVSQTAPQATITMSDAADPLSGSNEDLVAISHDGGEKIQSSDLEIVVRDEDNNSVVARLSGDFNDSDTGLNVSYNNGNSFQNVDFQSGDQIVLFEDTSNAYSDKVTLRVILVDSPTGQQIAAQTIDVE